MGKTFLTLATGITYLISVACVPTVSVENAACPCPNGYICCEASNRCIAETGTCESSDDAPCHGAVCDSEVDSLDSASEETATPTDSTDYGSGTSSDSDSASSCDEEACSVPVSSNAACRNDSDCPNPREVCLTWQDPQQILKGPAVCRQTCTGRCPEGEICELVLHDATPLEAVHVATACIEREPQPGCADVGCSACENPPYGSTVCNADNGVEGCFIALDTACGIYCRTIEIEPCGESTCIEDEIGAYCEVSRSDPYDQWCESLNCDEICTSESQGTAACEDGTVYGCVQLVLPERPCTRDESCACDALCRPLPLGGCD